MINIILVSATRFEIEPALRFLNTFNSDKISVTPCITNVGMVNTAFELGKQAGKNFDIAINAGIAGSFGRYKTGGVVQVAEDCFSELGAEDDDEFISIDTLGFGIQKLSIKNVLVNEVTEALPKASGITVNTTHGHEGNIKKIAERYNADVETMEGAAFIHAANAFGWQAIQLRAISNKVEKRNKEAWDIPLAIKALNEKLIELINIINSH